MQLPTALPFPHQKPLVFSWDQPPSPTNVLLGEALSVIHEVTLCNGSYLGEGWSLWFNIWGLFLLLSGVENNEVLSRQGGAPAVLSAGV